MPETTPQILDLRRLRSLWVFLCISLTSSWAVWLLPRWKSGSIAFAIFNIRLEVPIDATRLMIGICLPGLIAVPFIHRRGQFVFREFLSALLRWHVSLKWYTFAVFLPWGLLWTALGAVLFFSPSSNPRPSILWFLENLLLLLPFGPLWEELAWRGYAINELEARYSELKSALVLGVFWAIWHLPLWAQTLGLNQKTAGPVLTLGLISVVAWSVVFSFLYNRSGRSLLLVIILHAAFDSAGAAIFPTIQSGQILYIGISAALAVLVAAVMAKSMGHVTRP